MYKIYEGDRVTFKGGEAMIAVSYGLPVMTKLPPASRSRMPRSLSDGMSHKDRLYVIATISALPKGQFEQLIFALDPPAGILPDAVSQAVRSKALLDWAEGPSGAGLEAVDEILQVFVPKLIKPEQAIKPKAFAVSGRIGDLSVEELEAIVELLRKKTGDDSIDIAFYTDGSIKLVLNGTPEGLEKLQELFDSGELTEVLDGRPIEYVNSTEGDTTEARKARLIQVLRVCAQKENLVQVLARDLDQARARARDLARDLALDQARDLARDLDLALDQARDLARDLDQARDLARDLDQALARARAPSQTIELKHVDLSGANLKNLDLREIDLEGTNLTDADVRGTLFGDNQGLTDDDRRDLQSRGAIFQDPPNSYVPDLVSI